MAMAEARGENIVSSLMALFEAYRVYLMHLLWASGHDGYAEGNCAVDALAGFWYNKCFAARIVSPTVSEGYDFAWYGGIDDSGNNTINVHFNLAWARMLLVCL